MNTKNQPQTAKTSTEGNGSLTTFQPPHASNEGDNQPFYCLPIDGYSRANQVAKAIGIGLSTWWAWVHAGKVAQPIKLSSTVSVWRNKDIIAFVEQHASNDENYEQGA